MILTHSILALMGTSGINAVLMTGAAYFSYRILRSWDITSGSREQLLLERQTYLVSTILIFLMVIELLSLLLFVFTADELAVHFTGAMCAVGSLNANAYGFPTLILKMAMFFAAACWLALNQLDSFGRDYPLVRIKFAAVLLLTPLLLAEASSQARFFLSLESNVSVSCCSTAFAPGASDVLSEMTSLPPGIALTGFYVSLALTLLGGFLALKREELRGAFAGLATLFFPVALTAIISVFSLYIYEHPHHHCPFCIFKPEYSYFGYLLYAPLFLGCAVGMAVGPIQRFRSVPSLQEATPQMSRQLIVTSLGLLGLFALLTGVVVGRSHLILLGA